MLDGLELGSRAFERVTPEQPAQTTTQVTRRAAMMTVSQMTATSTTESHRQLQRN